MDKKEAKPVCPKCHGTNIQPVGRKRKGFSVGKAVAGGVLTGGVGTLAGFAGKNGKMEFYCSDCGKVFDKPLKLSGSNDKEREKDYENKKKTSKKVLLIVGGVVLVMGLIGAISGGAKKDKPQSPTPANNSSQEETKKNDDKYITELRKCTVMEGSDIYLTDNVLYLRDGIGEIETDIETAFNRAKRTCEGWYADWGEEEFYKLNEMDWETRQTEDLDGHPLTYYLDKLGW